MQTLKSKLAQYRKQIMMMSLLVMALIVLVVPSYAQSVSISLSPSDLDIFFTWFNTMFTAILPIALLGAGLVAGAAFAFVVGSMLKKAFQAMTGSAG